MLSREDVSGDDSSTARCSDERIGGLGAGVVDAQKSRCGMSYSRWFLDAFVIVTCGWTYKFNTQPGEETLVRNVHKALSLPQLFMEGYVLRFFVFFLFFFLDSWLLWLLWLLMLLASLAFWFWLLGFLAS